MLYDDDDDDEEQNDDSNVETSSVVTGLGGLFGRKTFVAPEGSTNRKSFGFGLGKKDQSEEKNIKNETENTNSSGQKKKGAFGLW